MVAYSTLKEMITALSYVLFWTSSIAAFISCMTLVYRLDWLPYWACSVLSLFVGAALGIAMVEFFVRLHGIKERFEQEPVNGATGTQITHLDLFMPYIQIGLLAVWVAPGLISKRRHNGLDIQTVPTWLLFLPIVMAFIMAIAVTWSQVSKRRSNLN